MYQLLMRIADNSLHYILALVLTGMMAFMLGLLIGYVW